MEQLYVENTAQQNNEKNRKKQRITASYARLFWLKNKTLKHSAE